MKFESIFRGNQNLCDSMEQSLTRFEAEQKAIDIVIERWCDDINTDDFAEYYIKLSGEIAVLEKRISDGKIEALRELGSELKKDVDALDNERGVIKKLDPDNLPSGNTPLKTDPKNTDNFEPNTGEHIF